MRFAVRNIVGDVDDGRSRRRPVWKIHTIAVHRIWFDDWDPFNPELFLSLTPDDRKQLMIRLLRRFVDDPAIATYTGGQTPYSLVVDPAGMWWQALPLSEFGAHARRWSYEALGVAILGDPRTVKPPARQMDSLEDGLALLCEALRIDPNGIKHDSKSKLYVPTLAGHDELPGGSSDRRKRCPAIKMGKLRLAVGDVQAARARIELLDGGFEA